MKILQLLLSFILLVTLPNLVFAQQRTVTGQVTDTKDNSPLVDATVSAVGTSTTTKTKPDGSFTINVPASVKQLRVSYIGYTDQTVNITSDNLTIAMAGSSANLNEVVVIGYGTVRKKDATGSLASVKAKDFNQGVVTNPDQLLQGKVSGLEITNNSGQPGAATTIKIRGNNSIRANNNPLYVIDGVPLDGRTARPNLNFSTGGFGPAPESNPLLYINPSDIAQIDVLKDASSTAIYGSRGANGIIVVTTKKATTSGTKLEFGTNFGVFAGYMKKYKVLSSDEFRSALHKYALDTLSTPFDYKNSVDPLKEITSNDLTQNYSMAVSGGNENGKFRASFLGSKTQGFIKKTSLAKYLGNFSGQYKFIDKRLSFDFSLIAGHTRENMGLISNTAGAGGNLMSYTLNWNPTAPFYTSNGLYNLSSNSVSNPIAVIDGFHDVADVNVFLGNISAGVKIIEGLDYKFLYAINHGTGVRHSSVEGWMAELQGITGNGVAAISNAALTSQTFTHTLNYNADLSGTVTLNAVAGYEFWKTSYANSTLGAVGFNTNLDQSNRIDIPYTNMMQNAKTQEPLRTTVDPTAEIQSVFGRVNLSFSSKYILTATLRADGSNKFGKNNRYGYFPSAGFKWAISSEDFLKGNTTVSNLGLRASWGITGNQEFPSGASLEQFGTTAYNSIGQSNVANPDLKWEKTKAINLGLDFGFLKNRITGSIDYYNKNTTDLLYQSTAIQPAPASTYYINLPANLINEGVEFSVNAPIIAKKTFSWDLGFNIAYNKNLLKNFAQAPIQTGAVSGNGVSGALAQIIANNYPVNEYYLKEFKGFDQKGQQIISDNPIYAGDPNPHVLMGFSTTLKYNKLSLTANASGAFGYLIYNNTYNTITNISQIGKGQNIAAANLEIAESYKSGVAASTRYLEKGDFVKLRNLTVNYAVGDVGKYVKGLSVYVSATNLFVITKFTGFDPEVNVDKSVGSYPSRNMEYIPYPTPRIITFGFNLGL